MRQKSPKIQNRKNRSNIIKLQKCLLPIATLEVVLLLPSPLTGTLVHCRVTSHPKWEKYHWRTPYPAVELPSHDIFKNGPEICSCSLCSHLVKNETVITPSKITLFKCLESNRISDADESVVKSRASVSRLAKKRKLIQITK